MVNKQLFVTPNLDPAIFFPYNMAEEIKAKVPFFESCNVNNSTKDGRLPMAYAPSSLCPSVFGMVLKSGIITSELDEINS